MHARTVIANDRLGHKGRGLAVAGRDVMDHIFQNLQPVGALYERTEFRTDFVLTRARHFVMVHFDRHTHLLKNEAHFAAHILEAIDRGHRKIAALHGGPMGEVAAFKFASG